MAGSETLNLLGGSYTPLGRFTSMATTSSDTEDPLGETDPTEDLETGTDDSLPTSEPETFGESRERLSNDDSQGGSNIADPAEPPKASADALQQTPPDTSILARTFPELRGFDERTFVLMHAYNLINLSNQKLHFEIDSVPKDK